jgi:hypothetical protein
VLHLVLGHQALQAVQQKRPCLALLGLPCLPAFSQFVKHLLAALAKQHFIPSSALHAAAGLLVSLAFLAICWHAMW